jgi:hypothetical protein
MRFHSIFIVLSLVGAGSASIVHADEEIIFTFDEAEVGKPLPSWTSMGIVFEPDGKLSRSKAKPRIMFFPHLKTEKKGVLSAMAAEPIPVRIRFPEGASKVTLVLWGSIGSGALVEALDKEGNVVDSASLERVPSRTSPADPIPSFELVVSSPRIAYVRFGGAHPGGFLAAEEIRFTRPVTGTGKD